MRHALQHAVVESRGRQAVLARHVEVEAGVQAGFLCACLESGRNEEVFGNFWAYAVHAPLRESVKVLRSGWLVEEKSMSSGTQDARQFLQDLLMLNEVVRRSKAEREIHAAVLFVRLGRQASVMAIRSNIPNARPSVQGRKRVLTDVCGGDMRQRKEPLDKAGRRPLSGAKFDDSPSRGDEIGVTLEQSHEDARVRHPVKNVLQGVVLGAEIRGFSPEGQFPISSVFDAVHASQG